MKRKGDTRIDDLDADELEGAQALVDLEIDRIDAVANPATGRGWLIRKAAALKKTTDVRHPNNNSSSGDLLDFRSLEDPTENPLTALDDQGAAAQRLLLQAV